jgi:hypothetical protein
MISATGRLFDLVFGLCRRLRLPLHIAGRIGATALQWLDVIDDEPRARPRGPAGCRAGMDGLECSPGRRASGDPAIGGTGADGAFLRRGRSIACDRRPVGRARCTPGRRAGTGAAGGCPRRCRSDQEAERQGSDGSGGGPTQRLEKLQGTRRGGGVFLR